MNTIISRRRLFTLLAATGGAIALPAIGTALAMEAGPSGKPPRRASPVTK